MISYRQSDWGDFREQEDEKSQGYLHVTFPTINNRTLFNASSVRGWSQTPDSEIGAAPVFKDYPGKISDMRNHISKVLLDSGKWHDINDGYGTLQSHDIDLEATAKLIHPEAFAENQKILIPLKTFRSNTGL